MAPEHPATPPGHDDDRTVPLPERHPDAPRFRRLPRLRNVLRKHRGLNHTHYDALTARLDRIDQRREEDFQQLWEYLAAIAERPNSVVLREILDELRDMRTENAGTSERLAKFFDTFYVAARRSSDAAGEFLGDVD